MKNYFLSILSFLAILIVFTGCEKTKEPIKEFGPEYSEQVKEIIDTKNAKIQAWYAKGMIDSVAVHFADNCIQMPPNQPPTKGKDNFIASWNQSIQFGTWQFDLKTQEVKASGDLATELGSYSLLEVRNRVAAIYDTVYHIIRVSKTKNTPTYLAAQRLALHRIEQHKHHPAPETSPLKMAA